MSKAIGMAKPPRSHQKLIFDMCVHINSNVDEDEFLALPEPNLLDGDMYSKQPDVLVMNMETEENAVAIEIEQKAGIKACIEKAKKYIADFQVKEAFVIEYKPEGFVNYSIKRIFHITEQGSVLENSYCETIDTDLNI